MVKVAHIVTAYGSAITILDSKLRALNAKSDLDVCVISSPADNQEKRHPAVRHISVNMARTIRPLMDIKSIWQLYRVFKREKFDIVHSHTAKAGFITAVAAKLAGVPLVLHTHHGFSFLGGENTLRYYVQHFLEKIASLFRDHTFTQNRGDISECISLMGSRSKVTFEGNGVDVEFVNKSAEEQLLDAQADYPGEGLKLVLLSGLKLIKRVADFFKVVDKLRQEGLKVSCVIAGTGVLEQQLKNQLAERELAQCVNMVGFSTRPHGLIKASDIVLLCSEREGIPRSAMEAMALQRPVVATDVLGTQELVVNGQTGFLVPLGDIDAMAEKVKLLAKDASLRKKMGAAGLQRVKDHFSDVKIAEFLADFYAQKQR